MHPEKGYKEGGKATQSSSYSFYAASYAIDGSKETNAYSHPCAHTNLENSPWWRVDLCVVISSIPAGASVSYTCNMQGRYVNVIIPGPSHILTLCEVEVYGVQVPVTKKAFLRLKFNSSQDLSNPIMRDKVLQKIKFAIAPSSEFQVSWRKKPEVETEA
ncbi:fucolectin-6-like [Tachysurus fulvidraco]|uniref:fucolectin-6-like n=1 Tax=Tachysurus fulvidraco TaxID=1234273 RepID=UPI001FF026E4|nr:fucolectin-6-like [Tachysurus fulvidraco]